MKARVKDNCQSPTIQSGGAIFVKGEWSPVPVWAEAEIRSNTLLETDEVQPMPEPEQPPEPQPKKLTKLVVPKSKRGKTL